MLGEERVKMIESSFHLSFHTRCPNSRKVLSPSNILTGMFDKNLLYASSLGQCLKAFLWRHIRKELLFGGTPQLRSLNTKNTEIHENYVRNASIVYSMLTLTCGTPVANFINKKRDAWSSYSSVFTTLNEIFKHKFNREHKYTFHKILASFELGHLRLCLQPVYLKNKQVYSI